MQVDAAWHGYSLYDLLEQIDLSSDACHMNALHSFPLWIS